MPKLTRSEREKIILDYVKGKKTPGWEVIERPNGKYLVKEKPIEIEEEEEETTEEEPQQNEPQQSQQPQQQQPRRAIRSEYKQNARQLLQQLSELINESEVEEAPVPTFDASPRMPTTQVNWNRKRLRF